MDQHSLSLKLFKKQQSKTKQHSLFLKIKRNYKKNLNENFILQPKSMGLKSMGLKSMGLKKTQKFLRKEKGQVLLEGLFFIISLISFLLAVHFFQTLAQKEIQKERMGIKKIHKAKKASWYKIK